METDATSEEQRGPPSFEHPRVQPPEPGKATAAKQRTTHATCVSMERRPWSAQLGDQLCELSHPGKPQERALDRARTPTGESRNGPADGDEPRTEARPGRPPSCRPRRSIEGHEGRGPGRIDPGHAEQGRASKAPAPGTRRDAAKVQEVPRRRPTIRNPATRRARGWHRAIEPEHSFPPAPRTAPLKTPTSPWRAESATVMRREA